MTLPPTALNWANRPAQSQQRYPEVSPSACSSRRTCRRGLDGQARPTPGPALFARSAALHAAAALQILNTDAERMATTGFSREKRLHMFVSPSSAGLAERSLSVGSGSA